MIQPNQLGTTNFNLQFSGNLMPQGQYLGVPMTSNTQGMVSYSRPI